MIKKRFKFWLLFFLIVSVVATVAFYVISNKFNADTIGNGVIYSGHVYVGPDGSSSTAPAVGAIVHLECMSSNSNMCGGTKNYSATADASGAFYIFVKGHPTCPYLVTVGSDKYNYKKKGTLLAQYGMNFQNQTLYVDAETDMMISHYPSMAGSYMSGYNGYYHLSQYDSHYLRNQITEDQIINKKIPASANFIIKIANTSPNFDFATPPNGFSPFPYAETLPINVKLSVYPVLANWSAENSIGPIVATKQLSIGQGFKAQSIEFNNIDLSTLTDEQRYQTWLNGFVVTFSFANDSDPEKIDGWKQINPDLRIARSEDGAKTVVSYSGLKSYGGGAEFFGAFNVPIDIFHHPGPAGDFGPRIHPITGNVGFHRGVDLSGSSAVYAVNAGKVASIGWDGAYGFNIKIDHCNGMSTYYNHLAKGSALVSVGDIVTSGQKIATVDTSGLSTGNHLHFDVSYNDEFIDPWPFIEKYAQK